MLGQSGEDYLKTIYLLSQGASPVTPTQVAEKLGVSPAAVVKMSGRLQAANLTLYDRKRGLRLTSAGKKIALEVLRHHRLLELYLTEALGYTWDQVHDEAERMEHVISEEFESKIDALLNYPKVDPHGDPIPSKEGVIDAVASRKLNEMQEGEEASILRVNDRDPEMLRYLGSMAMYPGTPIALLDREPFGGPLRIRVAEREHAIGSELAENVFVSV